MQPIYKILFLAVSVFFISLCIRFPTVLCGKAGDLSFNFMSFEGFFFLFARPLLFFLKELKLNLTDCLLTGLAHQDRMYPTFKFYLVIA